MGIHGWCVYLLPKSPLDVYTWSTTHSPYREVGKFPGHNGMWAEWNGVFRDNVRNFIRGKAEVQVEHIRLTLG